VSLLSPVSSKLQYGRSFLHHPVLQLRSYDVVHRWWLTVASSGTLFSERPAWNVVLPTSMSWSPPDLEKKRIHRYTNSSNRYWSSAISTLTRWGSYYRWIILKWGFKIGDDLNVCKSIVIAAGFLPCPWPENIFPPMADGYWVASIVTSCVGSEFVCERRDVLSFVFEVEAILQWSSLGVVESIGLWLISDRSQSFIHTWRDVNYKEIKRQRSAGVK
jgi:hypothetical protein